jgi:hypothetical protein
MFLGLAFVVIAYLAIILVDHKRRGGGELPYGPLVVAVLFPIAALPAHFYMTRKSVAAALGAFVVAAVIAVVVPGATVVVLRAVASPPESPCDRWSKGCQTGNADDCDALASGMASGECVGDAKTIAELRDKACAGGSSESCIELVPGGGRAAFDRAKDVCSKKRGGERSAECSALLSTPPPPQ